MSEETMLCARLTTDSGSIIEIWERDDGLFELLFAEAHHFDEIVHAVELRPVEVEMLGEKLAMAAAPAVLEMTSDSAEASR